MDSYDVVVVGGAAIGSAVAYFLVAHPGFRGRRVLVLEQDPTYTWCATTRSAASIRHQFSTPGNIRMSQFGTAFIRAAPALLAVQGEPPALGFREQGYLFLATAAGLAALEAKVGLQQGCGADVQLLDAAQLAERFPWLHTDDLAGGALGRSGEGWLDAHGLLHGLRRKALELGAHYRVGRAVGLQCTGGRVNAVQLADGTAVRCGALVNAAGCAAAALARHAGIALPVQPRKRCVFFFHSPAAWPGGPLLVDPDGAWCRPEGAGFIAGIAPPEQDDPACEDFEVRHELFDERLWPALAHRVPGFEAVRVQHAWAGHYDMNLLDHNLILGPHPQVDNLYFANGLSGHGLQQSPAIGRALAELIVAGRFETLDLSEFGWERVLAQRPLREINVV